MAEETRSDVDRKRHEPVRTSVAQIGLSGISQQVHAGNWDGASGVFRNPSGFLATLPECLDDFLIVRTVLSADGEHESSGHTPNDVEQRDSGLISLQDAELNGTLDERVEPFVAS
ncbi:MAG TPA: hypothetical protein VGP76_27510 [Planctomycetaceae bacterium]|nr:hypothetical protein [Planctomycetaceae bacterium]